MNRPPQAGDQVQVTYRGTLHVADVQRVNRKTITVTLEDGRIVRVRHSAVALAQPQLPDNVIPFPAHACGVGRRVKFRGIDGLTLTGVVASINRHGAEVIPDAGPMVAWSLRHDQIAPLDGTLSRRTDDEVMQDIARCYARMTNRYPYNDSAVRAKLRRRLEQLFRELGRKVDQQEAMQWALHRKVQ